MSFDLLREILVEIGVPPAVLSEFGRSARLRAELGLDSTETTDLELELKRRFGLELDLWGQVDYTLGQLAELIQAGEPRPLDPAVVRLPAARARRYREEGWWRPELVGDLVLRGGRAEPDRCAVVDGDRRLSHGELAEAVRCAAGRLHALGVRPGDRVGVQLPNCLEFAVLVLALLELGAPPVLILPAFRDHELEYLVSATRPVAFAVAGGTRRAEGLEAARRLAGRHDELRLLLVHGGGAMAGEVDLGALCLPDPAYRPEPRGTGPAPGDAAVFLLSGGTTGPPKAIPRAHEGYGYMIRTAAGIAGVSASSVLLAAMPAEHGFVLNCPGVLGVLAAGGRVVFGSADPEAAFALIERERVTHVALVPALAVRWLTAAERTERDLSSLAVLQVGGARPNPEAASRIRPVLGATLQQCYGMSEGLLNYTRLDDPDDVVLGTQGRPASPADELRVVDPAGEPVPPGGTGELLTRGPYTVAGYYRDPEADAKAFTADGFYRTGDLVRLTESGNLVVEGRVRDAINRGGEKISAEEIEAMALRHPAITAAAGVAMPHELYGEAVCLYVVADGPVDLPGLRRFLTAQGIARYKLPERLELAGALPATGIGKIDKKALRRDIAARIAFENTPAEASR